MSENQATNETLDKTTTQAATTKPSTTTKPKGTKSAGGANTRTKAGGKGAGKPKGSKMKAEPKQKAPATPKDTAPKESTKPTAIKKDEALLQTAESFLKAVDSTIFRELSPDEHKTVNELVAANKLGVAPMAKVMPTMSEDLFNGLVSSIKRDGLQVPIALLKIAETGQFMIVDGRHRYKAAQQAEVPPKYVVREVPQAKAHQVQVRDTLMLNIVRRNATSGQLACVGADIFSNIGDSIRDGLLKQRAAVLRAKYGADAKIEDLQEKDQAQYGGSVTKVIAAMLSGITNAEAVKDAKTVVSSRYIEQAIGLKKACATYTDPEAKKLFEKVKNGIMTLNAALNEMKKLDNPQEYDETTGKRKATPVNAKALGEAEIIELAVTASKQGTVSVKKEHLNYLILKLKNYIEKFGNIEPEGFGVNAGAAPDGAKGDDANEDDSDAE